tara:strand:- start:8417 stop:8992 length:576 start_codon:yes stop_codon:yes gene_type:complete
MQQIKRVPIAKIKNNEDNPRFIRDHKFELLVQSIKDFPDMLMLRPIIVNKEFFVLGGNMRLKACREAGLKTVPTIVADTLTPQQEAEFIIKDNANFGEWDFDLLKSFYNDEQLIAFGLDIPDYSNMFKEEETEKIEVVKPSSQSDDHSTYELIMLHQNKLEFQELLGNVQKKHGLSKQEAALMHIVRNYKL